MAPLCLWVTTRQDIENLQRANQNHTSYDECLEHALNKEQATYLRSVFTLTTSNSPKRSSLAMNGLPGVSSESLCQSTNW